MKLSLSSILNFSVSLLLGLLLALAFALPYFNNANYGWLDKFLLVAVPAFSLTFILYHLLPYLANWLKQIDFPKIVSANLLFGWLVGGIPAFFVAAFFGNFFATFYQIFALAFLFFLIFGILFQHIVKRLKRLLQTSPLDFFIGALLFAVVVTFQVLFFMAGIQSPKLFHAAYFLLDTGETTLFLAAGVISLPCLVWILKRLEEPTIQRFLDQNKLINFIRENLSGLSLSTLFLGLYLLIGSVLNHPRFDTDDIFFDSDGFIWRYRLTSDHWQDFYWRSVHPLALLILRPLVFFLSIFTNGDLPFAAILLTALTGAICIFLAWMFMKGVLQNESAALIMAALLGLSTSHLFYGSLIETYIFLAAATLLFFVLMQKQVQSLPLLIAVGVVTLGITLTNFAQTVIALFCTKPDFKFVFKFIFAVAVLVVSLTLVSNAVYPNAGPYFFVPTSFLAERQNIRPISMNRIQALIRAFAFNNIAAPTPMMSHKDIPFTQFRFYRAEDYTLSRYETPLQFIIERVWFLFLLLAAIFFVKDFKSHPWRLTLALIGCVLLNFIIQLRYGKELFLYSANWTYAIVFLLGISWKGLLQRRWYQIVLIAFLLLLVFNNMELFRTIMVVSSPYIK